MPRHRPRSASAPEAFVFDPPPDLQESRCGWYLRWLRLPGDTEEGLRRKKWFILTYVSLLVGCVAFILGVMVGGGELFATYMVENVTNVCGLACVVVSLCVARYRVSDTLLAFTAAWSTVALLARDLTSVAAGRRRSWPLFVVLVDLLLVLRAPTRITVTAVGCVVAYIAVMEAELAARFGLLDLPGLMPYSERIEAMCCERPPCATGNATGAVLMFSIAFVVLVFDFKLTRGFAEQMYRDRDALQDSARVAELVATSLARYDLDAAQEHLSSNTGALPESLSVPLRRILANLQLYRPYLPHEVLQRVWHDPPAAAHAHAPPRRNVTNAAIVMTSVREAGALWEHCSSAMHSALQTYSEIIRVALYTHNGQEVKAFGDSFVLTFDSALDAMMFSFEVQEKVSGDAVWPEGLGRPGMNDGFGVLSVKIGVDYGAVSLETSTLTGRTDYFGPTVGRAGRAEHIGVSGTVTATRSILDMLPQVVDNCVVLPHRGVEESEAFCAVLPGALRAQEAFVLRHCSARAAQEDSGSDASSMLGSAGNLALSSSGGGDGRETLSFTTGLVERTARAAATLGVVRYQAWGDAFSTWEAVEEVLSTRLAQLYGHLRGTDGYVSTVLNDMVVVSWGIHGTCPQHINESVRFMLRMQEEWGGDAAPCHAGLVTGPVACGALASSPAHLHVTMLGPCVDAALMLCAGAAEIEVAVLVASYAGSTERFDCGFLRDHLWPIDTWVLPLVGEQGGGGCFVDGGGVVTVYELRLASVAATALTEPSASHRSDSAGMLAEYRRAYARQDVEGLAALSDVYGPAAGVAKRVAQGGHLTYQLGAAAR